ncbi:MAG: hypothetical protein SFZ24_02155 [Planctomycetota bacterium]|nr:hypothetical protein [Planctomycetota bacterium]
MKHVKPFMAIVALVAAAGSAHAGVALPQGFDLTVQMGDGTPWSLVNSWNDSRLTVTRHEEIPGANGATAWSMSFAWDGQNWDGSFNLTLDPDPFVSQSFTIQNNSGVLQPFTVSVTLPIAPPLPGSTVMTGSVRGTVGDGDGQVDQFGNGATVLSQANGRPYYEAFIDGNSVRSLLTSPRTDSAPLGVTRNINLQGDPADFINELGPAALSTIGIRNAFQLTPGDNAGFTSTFLVVPAPGSLAVIGLAGLAATRRRR